MDKYTNEVITQSGLFESRQERVSLAILEQVKRIADALEHMIVQNNLELEDDDDCYSIPGMSWPIN